MPHIKVSLWKIDKNASFGRHTLELARYQQRRY
jgi:hypothetical protein